MIGHMEHETAGSKQDLLYIPSAAVLLSEKDHLGIRPCIIRTSTYLQEKKHSKKISDLVQNELCSVYHTSIFACQFTRRKRETLDTWQRAMQLLQVSKTLNGLLSVTEAASAAEKRPQQQRERFVYLF